MIVLNYKNNHCIRYIGYSYCIKYLCHHTSNLGAVNNYGYKYIGKCQITLPSNKLTLPNLSIGT